MKVGRECADVDYKIMPIIQNKLLKNEEKQI